MPPSSPALWPRLPILLLLITTACGAQAQPAPRDEPGFTAYVAERLKREVDAPVVIRSPLTLGVGTLQANLDRIFAFCARNIDGCEAEIETYVKGTAATLQAQDTPPSREALRVVVRTQSYVERLPAASSASAGPAAQPRPFAGPLRVLPVLDSPLTLRLLSVHDNETLGLNADEALRVATENTRAAVKPLMDVAHAVGRGQIGELTDDPMNPSRLVLVDSWAPLAAAQGGVLIAVAPTTNTVLYIGEDTPAELEALRAVAARTMLAAPNRLSDTLLRWTRDGWQALPGPSADSLRDLSLGPFHLGLPNGWTFDGSKRPIEGRGPSGEIALITMMRRPPGQSTESAATTARSVADGPLAATAAKRGQTLIRPVSAIPAAAGHAAYSTAAESAGFFGGRSYFVQYLFAATDTLVFMTFEGKGDAASALVRLDALVATQRWDPE